MILVAIHVSENMSLVWTSFWLTTLSTDVATVCTGVASCDNACVVCLDLSCEQASATILRLVAIQVDDKMSLVWIEFKFSTFPNNAATVSAVRCIARFPGHPTYEESKVMLK